MRSSRNWRAKLLCSNHRVSPMVVLAFLGLCLVPVTALMAAEDHSDLPSVDENDKGQPPEQLSPEAINQRLKQSRDALQIARREHSSKTAASFIARETLLQRPTVSNVQLSPDGRYLSFQHRLAQQTNLALQQTSDNQTQTVLADIKKLQTRWSGDSQTLWVADELGLIAIAMNKKTAKRLWKWDSKRHQKFIGVDTRVPAYAIIREKVADKQTWMYRYLRIDTQGKSSLLIEADKPVRDLLLTEDGALAFTATYEETSYDTVIRHHLGKETAIAGAKPKEVGRCLGVQRCRLMGYNEKTNDLFILSSFGESHLRLQHWQATNNSWQTLHRDPAGIADTSDILWDTDAQDWIAIAYHPDRRRWYGNGESTQRQLTALQAQLPDANLNLTLSKDRQQWLVQASQANWVLDRYFIYSPQSNALQEILKQENATQNVVPAEQLAKAHAFSFRARDGMMIHAYLYLPSGRPLAEVPLIASLHGGPYNRDRDDFQPITQLLVNRGYAVVTPNFRASTGYGQRYLLAAGGDFGNGKVLHDIVDALDYLIQLGIGDKDQQAVIGHSFGGYANLLAVSHHPKRFRFAVASAAPIDFYWGMNWIAKNGGSALPEDGPPPELFFQQHGIPISDRTWQKTMQRESPLALVQQLNSPIYLWAGAKDDRVPLKEVTHYAAEAKRYQKPVTLMVDPESDHGPSGEQNFEAIVYLIEAAAHKHFQGGLTPASSALATHIKNRWLVDENALGSASLKTSDR